MDSDRLKGRVALITGGSRGIGRATALKFAQEGAAVMVNYQQQAEAASEVVEQIGASGGRALALQADVGEPAAVDEMLQRSVREVGPIDILVNNAGVLYRGDLLSYKEDELDLMWRTNVKGLIHCTAAVVPSMKEKQFGRIINLSSIAALGTALAGTTFYAATKGAVLILTKRFAFELGSYGISVNAVCPGFIATDMVSQGRSSEEIQKLLGSFAAKSMLRRAGKPEDIANVICFLASNEAAFMTSQILTADAGRVDFLSHS